MTNEFDIINHPLVVLWIKEYIKNDPLAIPFITQGNEGLFKKMWGNPVGQVQNFSYWKKDYLGITIFVYTDKKTTFYKIQYLGNLDSFVKDKKIGSYLTGFLSKLIKEIIN